MFRLTATSRTEMTTDSCTRRFTQNRNTNCDDVWFFGVYMYPKCNVHFAVGTMLWHNHIAANRGADAQFRPLRITRHLQQATNERLATLECLVGTRDWITKTNEVYTSKDTFLAAKLLHRTRGAALLHN